MNFSNSRCWILFSSKELKIQNLLCIKHRFQWCYFKNSYVVPALLFTSKYFPISIVISFTHGLLCKTKHLGIFYLPFCYCFLAYFCCDQRSYSDFSPLKLVECCIMAQQMVYFDNCSIHIWEECIFCSWGWCSIYFNSVKYVNHDIQIFYIPIDIFVGLLHQLLREVY